MNSTTLSCVLSFQRLLGVILLLLLWPTLVVACLLIRITSYGSVFVVDEVTPPGGSVVYTYRLRTTGDGSPAFRTIGRYFRRYSIDELPIVWSLVRGDIPLSDAYARFRPR